MSTPTKEKLSELEQRLESRRSAIESFLLEKRAAGTEELSKADATRFRAMQADFNDMSERVDEYRSELQRVGTVPENLKRAANRGGGQVSSAGRLAPLGYNDEQLRRAYDQVCRGETAVLESRDFSPLAGLIPPDLGPILPVYPRHETRLLNFLPGISTDAPAIAYLECDATSGNAGIVNEGQAKPELTMPTVQKVATVRKIAAHTGISYEAWSGDYGAFVNAVQVELLKKVVDAENQQLYGGLGEAAGGINGIATATGILSFDASTVTTTPGPWDAIEQGIEVLRSGPDLAEPDLMLASPATWSAIRRTTDSYGRYYVAADPSTAEVNTAWGIRVLISTQFPDTQVILLDTQQYGRVVVREPLITRIGYSETDFTDNIVRYLSEERLTQTIERPKSILKITNLPTALTATKTTSRSK